MPDAIVGAVAQCTMSTCLLRTVRSLNLLMEFGGLIPGRSLVVDTDRAGCMRYSLDVVAYRATTVVIRGYNPWRGARVDRGSDFRNVSTLSDELDHALGLSVPVRKC